MFKMFSFSVATSLESSSWNLPNSTDLFAFLVSVEEERESVARRTKQTSGQGPYRHVAKWPL